MHGLLLQILAQAVCDSLSLQPQQTGQIHPHRTGHVVTVVVQVGTGLDPLFLEPAHPSRHLRRPLLGQLPLARSQRPEQRHGGVPILEHEGLCRRRHSQHPLPHVLRHHLALQGVAEFLGKLSFLLPVQRHGVLYSIHRLVEIVLHHDSVTEAIVELQYGNGKAPRLPGQRLLVGRYDFPARRHDSVSSILRPQNSCA